MRIFFLLSILTLFLSHTVTAQLGQSNRLRRPGRFNANVRISPDGKTYYTGWGGQEDRSLVLLRDRLTGAVAHTLKGHVQQVDAMEYAPDSRTLATWSTVGELIVWDAGTGKLKWMVKTKKPDWGGTWYPVAYSPDGQTLAVGQLLPEELEPKYGPYNPNNFGIVTLWDVPTGRLKHAIPTESVVASLAFWSDSKTLVTANSYVVQLWDVTTGLSKGRRNITFGDTGVKPEFSPDGKTAASAMNYATPDGGSVALWDVQTGKLLQTLKGHAYPVWRVFFSPDGKALVTIAVGSDPDTSPITRPSHPYPTEGHLPKLESEMKVWDIPTGKLLWGLGKGDKKDILNVVFSPDSQTFLSGNLWETRTGKVKQTSPRGILIFTPNSKLIAGPETP